MPSCDAVSIGSDAACLDLLGRAAFLGDGALLADLAVAAAPATDRFDDLLDEAEAAGLIHDDGERYRFDHPQLRQILYHEPSGRRRRRLHLALADQLEQRYGDDPRRAIEIADHLRRAGPSVDPTRLAARCAAAGEHALAMGAWGAAARFFDDAIAAQRPADEGERARLALRAGLGHFRDHDLPAAEPRLLEAIAAARAADDLDVWAAAALLVTRAWMTIGPDSVGALIDTSVLEELRADPRLDARRAGEVAGLLAEVHFHAFDFERGTSLLDEARLLAARHGDEALATSVELAAGLQHLGRLELEQAAACFHASAGHARLLADPWQRVWGLGRLPLVEVMLGELGAAAAHAAEAAAIAASNHDWAEHALASACAVQVATARGEFAAAEAAGVVAQQMQLRSDFAMVPLLLYPALAATLRPVGTRPAPTPRSTTGRPPVGAGSAPHRLLAIAAAHDPAALAAARPFRPVGARPVDLFTLPVLCAQAEVAVVSGDVALLTDAVEPLSAVHGAGVRWCLGWPLLVARLLAGACRVLGRLDEADHWCDVAAADADRGGARGEQARVGLERALLAEARGAPDAGRAAATDAAAALDRCGMLPLAQVTGAAPVSAAGSSVRSCSPTWSARPRSTCGGATPSTSRSCSSTTPSCARGSAVSTASRSSTPATASPRGSRRPRLPASARLARATRWPITTSAIPTHPSWSASGWRRGRRSPTRATSSVSPCRSPLGCARLRGPGRCSCPRTSPRPQPAAGWRSAATIRSS